MAYKAKKTEHSGSKKGCGAYWGRKRDAKRESSRARRRAAQSQVMADRASEPCPHPPCQPTPPSASL
jgi:hypothetical protein